MKRLALIALSLAASPLMADALSSSPTAQATLPAAVAATLAPSMAPTIVVTAAPTPAATLIATPPGATGPAPIPLVTAEETVVAVAVTRSAEYGHSGVIYQFSLSQWSVFNGSPLAYTPFELGYDFGNGLRVQSGAELFFYEGRQDDTRVAPGVLNRYSYEMQDWKTSVYYRVPMQFKLHPLVGASLDLVGGQRQLAPDLSGPGGTDINAKASKFPAWGYLGASAILGLEYLINPDWALNLTGRYSVTFTTLDAPIVGQLGLLKTF